MIVLISRHQFASIDCFFSKGQSSSSICIYQPLPKFHQFSFCDVIFFFFSIIVLCAVFMGGWRLGVILLPSRAFNWRWCVIEYIYYTPRK